MCGLNQIVCNKIVTVDPVLLNGPNGHHAFVYGTSDIFPDAVARELMRQEIMTYEQYHVAAIAMRAKEVCEVLGYIEYTKSRVPAYIRAYALGETPHMPKRDSWLTDCQWANVLAAASIGRERAIKQRLQLGGIHALIQITAWEDAPDMLAREQVKKMIYRQILLERKSGFLKMASLLDGSVRLPESFQHEVRLMINDGVRKRLSRFVRGSMKALAACTHEKPEFSVIERYAPDEVRHILSLHKRLSDERIKLGGTGKKRQYKKKKIYQEFFPEIQQAIYALTLKVPEIADAFLDSCTEHVQAPLPLAA